MEIQRLIEMFHLHPHVDEFVKTEVKKLMVEKNMFYFAGSPGKQCLNRNPHPPHATGSYNTVANGWGDDICDGVSGLTDEGEMVIVFEQRNQGDARSFGVRAGFWFVKTEK